MGTGYTRNDTVNNIADGNVINASDFDGEFDAIQAAFNSATGHVHDGTSNGAPITKVGPSQDIVVSSVGAIPKTNNTVDLGSATYQYKDIYIDGTAYIDALDLNGTVVTSTAAELNILDGVTSTAAELNVLDGITASTAELNILDGVTSTAAELNLLDGVTATTTEINYIDGVTSSIQTQLDAKQPLDAQLTDIAGLTPTDNAIIIGNGTNFVAESGATARTSLGLAIGTDVQAYDADLTTLGAGGAGARSFLGLAIGTDVQAYDADLTTLGAGGSAARAFLGLTIGTDVQAYDPELAALSGLTPTDNAIIVGNGTTFVTETGATARTSLGLAIGTDVQAYDAQLTDIAGLTPTDNGIVIGNGTNFVVETGATARTSLGLAIGTDVQAYDADLTTLGAGGSAARSFLGLAIGTDVQAYDAQLADVAGLTPTDNGVIIGNGINFVVESGATLKTSLGLTVGTDVQAYDAQLADIAGLTPTDNAVIIGNGTNFVTETGATARTSLGLAIGTDVQAYDADLTTLGAGGSAARSFLGLAIGTDVQAYDADTAKTDVAQAFTKAQRGTPVALTDATSIATDLSLGNNFSVTLGGNRTLANPTNIVAGQSGIIVITQDGTGSRTLAYGSYFKFPSATAPTLTTSANAVDVLCYYVESSTRITARLVADVR